MKAKTTLLLFLVLTGCILQAQENQLKKTDLIRYRQSIGLDFLSVNYSYNILQKEKWDFGIEGSAGIGGRSVILLFYSTPHSNENPFGNALDMTLTIEMLKIEPYFRYYYHKNNFFDVGINVSYLHEGFFAMEENAEIPIKNFAAGIDYSIFYGWKRIKLGTRFQANMLYKEHDNGNKYHLFLLMWTPIIIKYLF